MSFPTGNSRPWIPLSGRLPDTEHITTCSSGWICPVTVPARQGPRQASPPLSSALCVSLTADPLLTFGAHLVGDSPLTIGARQVKADVGQPLSGSCGRGSPTAGPPKVAVLLLTYLALSVILLPGCTDDCPTRGCTPSWEAGLWVRVLDAETGLSAACGAVAWATEGAYVDTLRASGCSMPESLQTGIMSGVHERPKVYEVHVEKPGPAYGVPPCWPMGFSVRSGGVACSDQERLPRSA